ncbi:DUF4062 domain-containing protein [Demequina sp. NBRC 110055]|uniref:DUF4062 domain-containing protein n=1 Tax=Demequina sp. NBRC 110055 TaxID=1570344 RepID=UPI0009FBF9B8|nr:DUF4062 domain-containing protein [Demequina sp. NBRC 110055]
MAKKELRVFVASPGGLDDARGAVEDVAGRLNSSLGDRLNVFIGVRKFEQMVARGGRPQSQINPWVDDCDVLIAIVHRRMGSPSGREDHSGFSEEFDRAISRFVETGSPVVSLHFKDVEPEHVADPGPDLAKVLEFRKHIEREHVGLHQRFGSIDAFKVNVQQLLVEEMHRAADGAYNEATKPTGNSVATTSAPAVAEPGQEHDDFGMARLLRTFANVISTGQVDDLLDVDRLALFAIALAQEPSAPQTHVVNRLFLRPNASELSPWELDAWFWAYVADHGRASDASDRVIPFVLAAGAEAVETRLRNRSIDFLEFDIEGLQRGYLRLLAAHVIRPDVLWSGETTSSNWAILAKAGLSGDLVIYWAVVSRAGDLPIAAELSASADPQIAKLGDALLSISDSDRSLDGLLALDPRLAVSRRVLARCGSDLLERVSTEVLVDLVGRGYQADDARTAAVREIAARSAWTEELVAKVLDGGQTYGRIARSWKDVARELLFESSDAHSVSLVLEAAAAKEAPERREVLVQFASVNPLVRGPLMEELGLGTDASEPGEYFALHATDPAYVDEAMAVLAGTFEPVNLRLERLRNAGAEEKVITFVTERGVLGALHYLVSVFPTPPKVVLMRLRELAASSRLHSYDALLLLEKVAADSDIPLFIDTAMWRWRDDPERLAALVSRATLTRLRALLDHEFPDLVLAALVELGKRDRPPSHRRLTNLLRHDDHRVRLAALAILGPKIPDKAAFVNEYVHAESSYYYNVVCELDRLATGAPEVF